MEDNLRTPLGQLSRVYKFLWSIERAFFRNFGFLSYRPSAKVISVGNLTFGGTGKTPVLLELLKILHPTRKVAVLTRGYKSPWERGFYLLQGKGPHPNSLTDEALLVNSHFPQIPVFLGKNRNHAARMAEKYCSPDLFLLDDGFQYRRLKKDIDLVLWDCTVDPEDSRLIPAGTLREPLSRLNEATVILLSRCESISVEIIKKRMDFLRKIAAKIPVIPLVTIPTEWISPDGKLLTLSNGPSRVFPFAAIAKPDNFSKQLKDIGSECAGSKWFGDHYLFRQCDYQTLAGHAEKSGSTLVCTEKDRIKIPHEILQKLGIFCLRISMKPSDGNSLEESLKKHGVNLQQT